MDHPTKLTYAMRAASNGSTEAFLRHRNALRKTMVLIIADIAGSDWSMAEDALLDSAEAWLRDRMGATARLPRAEVPSFQAEEVA